MHAFEPEPSTRALLEHIIRATGVQATVHAAAVGNSSAPVYLQPARAGFEGTMPEANAPRTPSSSAGNGNGGGGGGTPSSRVAVQQLTVDGFMAASNLRFAHHVLIDSEGWDGLVLAGMARTLEARRAGVVEFEYCLLYTSPSPRDS